ncbi:hypothetical protein Taro_004881, partial [Colocasia esculenta]|nr:hypothetical protein [Colocasia esculenta]
MDSYRDAFSCHDRGDATVPVLSRVFSWFRLGCRRVPQGWLALRIFRWGTRQVTWLCSVTKGDTFVAVSWRRSQEVRVCLVLAGLVLGYKPAVRRGSCCVCPACSLGAWHLRPCPVQRLSLLSETPHPREPVEGVLWATSVLELAADLANSGAEGKT